jgi:uridine kinase
MKTLIIHVSGASGSRKTTLDNKLKEQFTPSYIYTFAHLKRRFYYINKKLIIF